MKSRLITLILSVTVVISYTARIAYINIHSLAPEVVTYKIGNEVQIEDNYFDNSSEKMNGYSITVLDTDIISIDEFQKQYNDYYNKMDAEYMYLLKVRFKNEDNNYGNNAGIDLSQYMLQETSYINFIDREAYEMINGFDSIKFSLRENSEMEFVIPFHIDSFYIDVKKLKAGKAQLVISLYPHKKVIKLKTGSK